jgi:hypothetical protein
MACHVRQARALFFGAGANSPSRSCLAWEGVAVQKGSEKAAVEMEVSRRLWNCGMRIMCVLVMKCTVMRIGV